ncbi:hypothetical protein ACG2OD_32130 [Streptomyces sp. PDY-4]|uniref:Uncharacterized protein n=1 Tax=Streptomyces fungicidicus TaxID=68203 RepID=A0A494UVW1_9ACTN|nr:hypothetical protein [Streptomyces fungicidicus]AYL34839.1 hypothetical protein CNQ36_05010 [Streptomyces fungicidicus]
MNPILFRVLVLPLLAAECVAQFVWHDQAWTTVFALLALAVIAVWWAMLPRPVEECHPDCPKCAESLSEGEQP